MSIKNKLTLSVLRSNTQEEMKSAIKEVLQNADKEVDRKAIGKKVFVGEVIFEDGSHAKKLLSLMETSNAAFARKISTTHQKLNESNIIFSTSEKSENRMTPTEKMTFSLGGVTKKDLENLKNRIDIDYDTLGDALSVTRTTLINKKGNEKFNTVLSERIVDLAVIYSYGFEVFGDEDIFKEWMSSDNKALGGHKPLELVSSQFGREEVKDLIGRIAWGVHS